MDTGKLCFFIVIKVDFFVFVRTFLILGTLIFVPILSLMSLKFYINQNGLHVRRQKVQFYLIASLNQ